MPFICSTLERQNDLLLTDVVMPGMSGIELANAIRELDPSMPIVLASGYSEETLEGAGAEFAMLRKPFDPRSLSQAIETALRQVQLGSKRRASSG